MLLFSILALSCLVSSQNLNHPNAWRYLHGLRLQSTPGTPGTPSTPDVLPTSAPIDPVAQPLGGAVPSPQFPVQQQGKFAIRTKGTIIGNSSICVPSSYFPSVDGIGVMSAANISTSEQDVSSTGSSSGLDDYHYYPNPSPIYGCPSGYQPLFKPRAPYATIGSFCVDANTCTLDLLVDLNGFVVSFFTDTRKQGTCKTLAPTQDDRFTVCVVLTPRQNKVFNKQLSVCFAAQPLWNGDFFILRTTQVGATNSFIGVVESGVAVRAPTQVQDGHGGHGNWPEVPTPFTAPFGAAAAGAASTASSTSSTSASTSSASPTATAAGGPVSGSHDGHTAPQPDDGHNDQFQCPAIEY